MTTRNDSKVSFLKLVFLKSIQLVVSLFILLIRPSSFPFLILPDTLEDKLIAK